MKRKILSATFAVALSTSIVGVADAKPKWKSYSSTDDSSSCVCDGKLTTLTLQYTGSDQGSVIVIQQNGDTIYSDAALYPSKVFSLTGTDQRGKKVSNTTFGPSINFYLDDGTVINLHTSCSIEINVGDEFGPFKVLSGTSRNNGLICGAMPPPPPPPPPCGEECDD